MEAVHHSSACWALVKNYKKKKSTVKLSAGWVVSSLNRLNSDYPSSLTDMLDNVKLILMDFNVRTVHKVTNKEGFLVFFCFFLKLMSLI